MKPRLGLRDTEIRTNGDQRRNDYGEYDVFLFRTVSEIQISENEGRRHGKESEERRRNEAEFRNERERDEGGYGSNERRRHTRNHVFALRSLQGQPLVGQKYRHHDDHGVQEVAHRIERRARHVREGVSHGKGTTSGYRIRKYDEPDVLGKMVRFEIEGREEYHAHGHDGDRERGDRSVSKQEERRDYREDRRQVLERHEGRQFLFLVQTLCEEAGVPDYHRIDCREREKPVIRRSDRHSERDEPERKNNASKGSESEKEPFRNIGKA